MEGQAVPPLVSQDLMLAKGERFLFFLIHPPSLLVTPPDMGQNRRWRRNMTQIPPPGPKGGVDFNLWGVP